MAQTVVSGNVSKRELEVLGRILRRHYDIGVLLSAKRNLLGYMNANYEVETGIGKRRKRYIVRIYRSGLPKGDIDFEHSLLKELKRRSFHYAPQPIRAHTGHSYVQTAKDILSGRAGCFAAVFEYKAGEDKYRWDRPFLTDAELKDAAGVLARYHTIIHRWTPQPNVKVPCTLGNLSPMCRRWKTLKTSDPSNAFGIYFEAHRDVLLRAADRLQIWKAATNRGDLPVIAVHGDYHPGNLKFSEGKVIAVLDFDWSHMDHRVYDIALAAFYCCASWQADSDGWIQLDRLGCFLSAYQLSVGRHSWGEPIAADETACLPQMIQLANLFIADWTIHQYFTRGGTEQAYLRYLRHTVRVAEWLENNHQRLVDAINAFI